MLLCNAHPAGDLQAVFCMQISKHSSLQQDSKAAAPLLLYYKRRLQDEVSDQVNVCFQGENFQKVSHIAIQICLGFLSLHQVPTASLFSDTCKQRCSILSCVVFYSACHVLQSTCESKRVHFCQSYYHVQDHVLRLYLCTLTSLFLQLENPEFKFDHA